MTRETTINDFCIKLCFENKYGNKARFPKRSELTIPTFTDNLISFKEDVKYYKLGEKLSFRDKLRKILWN